MLPLLNLNSYVDAQNSTAALQAITSSLSLSATMPKIGTSYKNRSVQPRQLKVCVRFKARFRQVNT